MAKLWLPFCFWATRDLSWGATLWPWDCHLQLIPSTAVLLPHPARYTAQHLCQPKAVAFQQACHSHLSLLLKNSQSSNTENHGKEESGWRLAAHPECIPVFYVAWRGRPHPQNSPPVWPLDLPCTTTLTAVWESQMELPSPKVYPPKLPPIWAARTGVEPVEFSWSFDPRLFFRQQPGLAGSHWEILHLHPQTPVFQVGQKKRAWSWKQTEVNQTSHGGQQG